MIIIKRGTEPASLRNSRSRRLPKAKKIWRSAGCVTDELRSLVSGGYQVANVKRDLFLAQHKKCAFCEIRCGYEENPIEHFRPKKHALRNLPNTPPDIDRERYWWLAWSWSNLLFACHRCNGASNKGNYFPLLAGGTPLPVLSTELEFEHPLLLDPSDPELRVAEHLAWRPLDRSVHISRWSWKLETLSPRGHATQAILRLDYRADDVTDRFRHTVWPRFHDRVRSQLEHRKFRPAHEAWDALRRELLHPEAELVFATWCMLDVLKRQHPTARLQLDPL